MEKWLVTDRCSNRTREQMCSPAQASVNYIPFNVAMTMIIKVISGLDMYACLILAMLECFRITSDLPYYSGCCIMNSDSSDR